MYNNQSPFKTLAVLATACFFLNSAQANESIAFPELQRNADGIAVTESGNIQFPSPAPGAKIWVGFISGNSLSQGTTRRFQEVLEKSGYKITNNQEKATIKLEITGTARIRNEEEDSFDTGDTPIRDILTEALVMDTTNSSPDYRPNRPVDGGIAYESNKAISQMGGSTGGGLAGIGVAIGINIVRAIFDSNSKPDNKPFKNIVGARSNRPLICFDACRRTHHEVTLNILMPAQGSQASQHYSVYVDKLSTSVDEDAMHKLANMAFDALAKHLSTSIVSVPATDMNVSAAP